MMLHCGLFAKNAIWDNMINGGSGWRCWQELSELAEYIRGE